MRWRTLIIVAVLLVPASADADDADDASSPDPARLPMLILPAPRVVCKDRPTLEHVPECRDLPPGRFIDEPAFQALDVELKTLQTDKVRRDAENKSLRETASGWQPGWRTLAATFATGFVAGAYAAHRWL